MARRNAQNGTSVRRRGPGRVALWAPVVLTFGLLGSAVAADQWALGPTYLGWKGGDPSTDPAAVDAPGILGLEQVPVPPVVAEASPTGTPLTDLVSAAVARDLADDSLGKHVVVAVAGIDGVPVYSSGRDALIPASTAKVLTAVAALEVLGPDEKFSTVVEQGTRPEEIVLVGGGDPYLMAEPTAANAFPLRADLTTLALDTATKLAESGTTRVKLRYDTSLFDGPADNPAWERGYVAEQVVSPITALWVNSGKDPSGWGRVEDPAREAAKVFAQALEQVGVTVSGPQPGSLADAVEIASVDSAPLSQIVERVLDVSDNEGAELLARHIGLAVGDEGSFAEGSASILSTLEGLGVDVAEAELHDGSGLARTNHVRAETLLQTLAAAASEENPHLRAAIDGLPTAGFTGSLRARFVKGADAGLGRVRAKTGTLTGVHVLAGVVTGADGIPMLFVAGADRVAPVDTLDARATLDRLAAGLAECSCSSAPSVSPSSTATSTPEA